MSSREAGDAVAESRGRRSFATFSVYSGKVERSRCGHRQFAEQKGVLSSLLTFLLSFDLISLSRIFIHQHVSIWFNPLGTLLCVYRIDAFASYSFVGVIARRTSLMVTTPVGRLAESTTQTRCTLALIILETAAAKVSVDSTVTG
jgi:hypothetical protein